MTSLCTLLLAELLVVAASAQWPRLPKIDPGHIAGVVQGAEKEAKQTLSQKSHLLSQLPSVADNVAQSAAQAVSASAQTAESTKAIAGDFQSQQQILVSEVTKEAKNLHRQAPSVAGNVAQSAAQAVSASVQTAEAAKAIAGDAQAQQQVGAVGGPTALNPSKVTGGLSKVVVGASTRVEAASPMTHEAGMPAVPAVPVAQAVPAAPVAPAVPAERAAKAVPAAPSAPLGPAASFADRIGKYINGGDDPEAGEQASKVDQGVKWVGLHWQWSLLFIVGALGVLVFGRRVTKHRHARSPPLLADNDMDYGWLQ